MDTWQLLYSVSGSGWSLDSCNSISAFFTFCCVAPAGPPQNVAASPLSSRTLELSWGAPAAELQNGLIRRYHITIRRTQDRNFTTTANTLVVENLHPFYTYECVVTAVTVGAGPSATIMAQLPQDSKKREQ